MGGENSWGRERVHISQLHAKRDLDKWNHLLGMTKEKRVISKLIPGAIGYCEGERLQPCGATLRVGCNDDIVLASFKTVLEVHDVNSHWRTDPEVLVEHQWLCPTLSCWKFGEKMGTVALR